MPHFASTRLLSRMVFVLVLLSLLVSCSAPSAKITPPEGYKLLWSDEFDGKEIDLKNWTYDLGAGGWGNGEAQYYTNRPENARIEDGMLVIEALQEKYEDSYYTSARLKTQGLQTFQYGRIEARVNVTGALDPVLLDMQEKMRAHAMYPKCFDVKTSQLMLFGMLMMDLNDAAPLHGIAARRAGATWEELQAVVSLAFLFRGLSAANRGAELLANIAKREADDEAAAKEKK